MNDGYANVLIYRMNRCDIHNEQLKENVESLDTAYHDPLDPKVNAPILPRRRELFCFDIVADRPLISINRYEEGVLLTDISVDH